MSRRRAFNVLLSSAGRRVRLLELFRAALDELGLCGRLIATDMTSLAPAWQRADARYLVPACGSPDFVERLLQICREHDVRLLVPTIDPELPVLAANRDRFAAIGTTVLVSAPAAVAIAADKRLTHRWLTGAGMPTVRQAAARDLAPALGEWPLPLIAKPRNGSASAGVRRLHDRAALEQVMTLDDYVVETIASGTEHTVDVLVGRDGRAVCAVPRRRLEVRAGEVAKAVTVRSPAMEELARRVGEELPGAYGPINVQMFAGPDERLAVVEINARFGGGFPLSDHAGARYPRWVIEEVAGLPSTAAPDGWRAGVCMLRYDAEVFVEAGPDEPEAARDAARVATAPGDEASDALSSRGTGAHRPQRRIHLSPPDMGAEERRLLLEAFDSNWIAPVGPHIEAFEREFADAVGVPCAVAVSSGTAALHLALRVAGVVAGQDVITSTLTFAATANAITYVGARPVFVDVSPATWTLDPELLEAELRAADARGERPAAVVAVDLYGQCADYARIEAICARHGVPLIEDAAEGLGAHCGERSAGGFGLCAAFSFNGNKIITTSGGGMLVARDAGLADRARHLATQARDPAPHYEHSEIGFNYRMSNLLAAVGRGQLRALAHKVARRRAVNGTYRTALGREAGLAFMPEAGYGRSSAWLTCVLVDPSRFGASCEDVRLALAARDIEARPVWKPMHLQPVFERCRVRGGAVAEALFHTGLCLPSGSSLTEAEQAAVIDAIRDTPRRSATAGETGRPGDG